MSEYWAGKRIPQDRSLDLRPRTPWLVPIAFYRVAVIAALAGFLSGCRTAVNFAALADAQLAAQVRTALVNSADVGARAIEVRVAQGEVSLSGTVQTEAEADRAEAVARSVQGVRDVRLNLQIGNDATPPLNVPASGESQPSEAPTAVEGDPRFLAVGTSFGWSGPRVEALNSHASIGPLVRLGSGRGLGAALALNWFTTTVTGAFPDAEVTSRIYVRPIMGGLGYTWAFSRVTVSPSLVGGVAFNSLTVPKTGEASHVAVEVGNSVVWRPGVSVWFDVSRRAALNLSTGYVVTGLRVTFLEDGQLVKRNVRGDTTIVHAGIAYKLF